MSDSEKCAFLCQGAKYGMRDVQAVAVPKTGPGASRSDAAPIQQQDARQDSLRDRIPISAVRSAASAAPFIAAAWTVKWSI